VSIFSSVFGRKGVKNSDIFVNENENEIFLKNENRIRTKINLSERIEINNYTW
jgi:hypothetical protein